MTKQNQTITVNRLPAKTWNWLKMNETVIGMPRIDGSIAIKQSVAEAGRAEDEQLRMAQQTDWDKITTGMGEAMDQPSETDVAWDTELLTIPEHADEKEQKPDEFAILDERFLEKPAFAMELCKNATIKMAEEAKDALELSLENLHIYDGKRVEKIIALEQSVDRYEDALGTYLVKLNNCDLSQSDSRTLSILLHCIGNFERISDHAVNITDSLTEMNQKDLHFSKKALEEMEVFSKALKDIVEATCTAFVEADLEKARRIEPFEQVIDGLSIELKQRHVHRLRKGKCTIELGLILEDIITNYERISDHCSNIAVCMIRVNEDGFDTHEYLDVVKEEKAPWFEEEFYALSRKYALPEKKRK